MASQKQTVKQSPKNSKRAPKQQTIEVVTLKPETKKWVVSIVLFVLSAITFLALFGMAGVAGSSLLSLMHILMGRLAFLFPIIFFIAGALHLNKEKLQFKTFHIIGLALFVLSLTGLVHLTIPASEMVNAANRGIGGGVFGLVFSYPLLSSLGSIVATIICVAALIIGFLLVVNSTLDELADTDTWLGKWIESMQARWYDLRYGNIDTHKQMSKEANEQEYEEVEEITNVPVEEIVPVAFVKKEIDAKEKTGTKEMPVRTVHADDTPTLEPLKNKISYRKVDLPLTLLLEGGGKASTGNIIRVQEKIQKTLENFNIPVTMGEIHVGPTFTQYELSPAEGIKLSRITALQDDLALALAAHPLRIEAPIPGKSAVGVEIPNTVAAMVRLRELLDSKVFKSRTGNLEVALGKDVSGKVWSYPIDKMPHLLVAGSTGSGKSVCLNTIIVSLLYQNSPETLRFIMVDPKKVELTAYADIPHLLTPVITDVKKTVNALKWAVAEMERRYTLLSSVGKRNIDSYNTASTEKLPYIVFVIDEMADLMVSARNEVETLIIRLAQMARAVGIHLVLATQRPSVDVITGLIKANIPSRIAFAVASLMDSRTILDCSGAEKLVGKGDMLFSNPQHKSPIRIQGAFLSEDEVTQVTDYLKERSDNPIYDTSITEKNSGASGTDFSDPDDGDELFDEARTTVIQAGRASTSFLQRKFKIGYSRAARLMDLLEQAGVVGPGEGAKPREILISKDDLDTMGYDSNPDEVRLGSDNASSADDDGADVSVGAVDVDESGVEGQNSDEVESTQEDELDEVLEEVEKEVEDVPPVKVSKKESEVEDDWL